MLFFFSNSSSVLVASVKPNNKCKLRDIVYKLDGSFCVIITV